MNVKKFEDMVDRFKRDGLKDEDARRIAAHTIAGGIHRSVDHKRRAEESSDQMRINEAYYTNDVNVTHDYSRAWI